MMLDVFSIQWGVFILENLNLIYTVYIAMNFAQMYVDLAFNLNNDVNL